MSFGAEQDVRAAAALPHHHLADDMLLAYAAGTINEAAALVVAAHVSLCPRCRAAVLSAEAVGGALLEGIEPQPVSQSGLTQVLDRLDTPATRPAISSKKAPAALFGTPLPQPIAAYLPEDTETLHWSWVSPGVKFAELLNDSRGARVGLMRTMPGAAITPHGHNGDELTLVLSGGFRDGHVGYRRGDVQAVDENVTHEPVTDADGACLSLVMIEGKVKPTRLIARIFRHFTDF